MLWRLHLVAAHPAHHLFDGFALPLNQLLYIECLVAGPAPGLDAVSGGREREGGLLTIGTDEELSPF